jgi:hypothetical protein
VRSAGLRGARLLVLPTVVLLGVAVFASGRLELAVRIYALIVCAVALALAVGSLRNAFPQTPRHRSPRRGRERRADPRRGLAQLENEVTMGAGNTLDLHFLFRPHLRLIAAGLLEGRRGVALDEEPERARRLLGDETWELVRADRPVPADRRGPGLSTDALERVVVSLERL